MDIKQALTYLRQVAQKHQTLQGPVASIERTLSKTAWSPSGDGIEFEAKLEVRGDADAILSELGSDFFGEFQDYTKTLEGAFTMFLQKESENEVFIEAHCEIDLYYFHHDVKAYVNEHLRSMDHSSKDLIRETKNVASVAMVESIRGALSEHGIKARRADVSDPRILMGNKAKKKIGRILRNHLEEV